MAEQCGAPKHPQAPTQGWQATNTRAAQRPLRPSVPHLQLLRLALRRLQGSPGGSGLALHDLRTHRSSVVAFKPSLSVCVRVRVCTRIRMCMCLVEGHTPSCRHPEQGPSMVSKRHPPRATTPLSMRRTARTHTVAAMARPPSPPPHLACRRGPRVLQERRQLLPLGGPRGARRKSSRKGRQLLLQLLQVGAAAGRLQSTAGHVVATKGKGVP